MLRQPQWPSFRQLVVGCALCFVVPLLSASCGKTTGPQTGSQTNWLKLCDSDADCGELSCICSSCTLPCDDDDPCSELPGATCAASSDSGAVALCGGQEPEPASVCVVPCDDQSCNEGFSCQAGVCAPVREATAQLTVDRTVRFQTLVGIGATIRPAEEDNLLAHPEREAILDAMFVDSGLEMIRLLNRFDGDNAEELDSAGELVSAGEERLDGPLLALLTSKSPPANLKENGDVLCTNDASVCTLVRDGMGAFDYAGLATHFRDSLQAYGSVGVSFDYLSIQDNPNFSPLDDTEAPACRFLPEEGTLNVEGPDGPVDAEFPGLNEAIAAVRDELDGLATVPAIVAPEGSGVEATSEYVVDLDLSQIDAIAHHMYGLETQPEPESVLQELGELAQQAGLPLFQTEMREEGLETAVLMQQAFVEAGVSVYLQNDFVASDVAEEADTNALISMTDDEFQLQLPYHVMRHFAAVTDSGWVRVEVDCGDPELLCSAWVSPSDDELSVIVLNRGQDDLVLGLQLDEDDADLLANSEVTRTTFSGLELSASLGELPDTGTVSLPGESMVSIALAR